MRNLVLEGVLASGPKIKSICSCSFNFRAGEYIMTMVPPGREMQIRAPNVS